MKSDYTSNVEIWLFCACAMKYVHYNPYYMNSLVIADSAMGQILQIPQNVLVNDSNASECL